MSYWYQYATTSNRLNRSYINGFLDISGGDLTLRNSNFNMNGLIAQNTTNIPQTGSANVSYSYISWNDVSNNFLSSVNSGTLNGSLSITNDLSVNGNLYINSQSNHQITVTATSFAVTEDMSLNGRLYVSSDASLNGRLFVGSDVSLGGRLFVTNDASLNKRLYVGGDININGNIVIPNSGTHTITGTVTTSTSVTTTSTVTGNETVNGTETVGNLVVSNSLFYTPSAGIITAAVTLSQPLATVYFINVGATAIQITLPTPVIATTGQVIHFRRTGGTTTTVITFATNPANFVVSLASITGGTATLGSGQYNTKFISNGSTWYQVYLQ